MHISNAYNARPVVSASLRCSNLIFNALTQSFPCATKFEFTASHNRRLSSRSLTPVRFASQICDNETKRALIDHIRGGCASECAFESLFLSRATRRVDSWRRTASTIAYDARYFLSLAPNIAIALACARARRVFGGAL